MVSLKPSRGDAGQAGSPLPYAYLLREALLFLLFTYCLLFANTWRAYADYNLIRLGVAMLALASLGWLMARPRRPQRPPTPLSAPLLLFTAIYFVAALASIRPRQSLDEVWVFAMYVFGFALTAHLVGRGWPRELFVKTLLLAGGLLMAISAYVALTWYMAWLAAAPGQWIPDIAYRLPLANGQATYLYLMLFAVIARRRVTHSVPPRLFLTLWIFPALILLFLTASRGGWLAAAAGLLTIGFVEVHDAGGAEFLKGIWARARRQWQMSMAVGMLMLLGLSAAGWLASRQVINPQKGPAALARIEFWAPAWNAFLQRPLLGQGPLTYGSAYLRFHSVPPNGFFPHAHSIFFNLLTETGVAGVLGFGVLALATFRGLWHQVLRLTGHDRAVAIAALAGAVGWAAHSLVDTVQAEPMNSLLITVLLGAALAPPAAASPPGAASLPIQPATLWRSYWPFALGLTLTVSGVHSLWRLAPLHAGVSLAGQQRWHEAALSFELAAERDPWSTIAHQQSGLAHSILASQGEPGAIDAAVAHFEVVVRLDPDWWLNRANLAALYLARGDMEAALSEYRAAVRLGPGAPMLQLNYGVAAETAGRRDEAREAYLAALKLSPNWAEAYFWRASPFRADLAAEWQAASPANPPLTLTHMQALADGGDRAGDYTPLAAYSIQAGLLDQADLLLRKADLSYSAIGPIGLEVLWWKAELAAARGDLESAVALGKAAVEGYQLQSAFGPGTFAATSYGQVFFRQETMPVELAPQLTPAPFTDTWAARLGKVGRWYEQMGDPESAAKTYQRLLNLVPDSNPPGEAPHTQP